MSAASQMVAGKTFTSHKCPHCGKFHGSNAGASNPDGKGSADEGEGPGGSDGGIYDAKARPDGGNDNDNLPLVSGAEEKADLSKAEKKGGKTKRAKAAVAAKLKEIAKRDGER